MLDTVFSLFDFTYNGVTYNLITTPLFAILDAGAVDSVGFFLYAFIAIIVVVVLTVAVFHVFGLIASGLCGAWRSRR